MATFKLTEMPARADVMDGTIAQLEHLVSSLDYAFWRCYKDGTEIPEAFREVFTAYTLVSPPIGTIGIFGGQGPA